MSISFITWVNNEELYKEFIASADFIKDAEFIKVGCKYTSMATAYNAGLKRATGNIFIFVHQDVRILDPRFPNIVEDVCKKENLGFAGVIGNIELAPAHWWGVKADKKRGSIITSQKKEVYEEGILSLGAYNGPARQIDGLLMVTNKRFIFPEELPSIHFLDLWMCHEAEKQGYTNWIFNALLEHLSIGNPFSAEFRINKKIYERYWEKQLLGLPREL